MAIEAGPEADHHVSGLYTNMLLSSLAEQLSPAVVQEVLSKARETRSLDEIISFSSWSSYHQFRRLLEESKCALEAAFGDSATLASVVSMNTEIAETAQQQGSPSTILASASDSNAMVPIREYQKTQVGPNEWTIRERFADGYAPYREWCEFAASQYALIPLIFGLASAEVVEEECQCRGDPTCLFRLKWEESDSEASRTEYFRVRAELLEARLRQLRHIVTDLVSIERYEDFLQGIVGSSMRAAAASGAVLALEPRPGSPLTVYSEGLTEEEAASLANEVLLREADLEDPNVIEVASARRHYGVLATGKLGGIFSDPARATLETYSQLAAAALDAADALEEARHQARTAHVLLELSSSLADIVSTEEMAAKVARAVPDVIDCDRAAVFLESETESEDGQRPLHLVASVGYSEQDLAVIRSRKVTLEVTPKTGSQFGLVRRLNSVVGTAASLSAPISIAGIEVGVILAGVTSDPDRLTITPRVADRLKGLAAQASIALNNSRLVDQIRFQAVHDPLTGLPNRALIMDRAEQMLARARRSYSPVAVLFVDLDGFKEVNDTLGHGIGDQLLQAVATRLTNTMRASDSVGRLGGDEFVVLVDGLTMDAGPELVAERLLEVLREPFTLEDGTVSVPVELTTSIGIAAGSRASAAELLRDADVALYQAKAAGKNSYIVYRPEMHTAVRGRHLREMDLRDALDSRQYFLVYQPILSLQSGQVTGVEALLRWNHPIKGVIRPDGFIPILEASGLITDVGRWVLEEACQQAARWHAGGHPIQVSVNVASAQLESNRCVDDVLRALDLSGLDPSSLVLEVPETAIMRSMAAVVPRLGTLRDTGISVAIDDFGTGYSSLSYLREFPADILKIDRSFVSAMEDSPESRVLVHTLVQIGKTLGLETVAEGIERAEQRTQLEREQCESGQGNLFARPLDVDAVEEFLLARSAAPLRSV
jgi:diguanylate cyclase (GGDEF)-like protein